MDEQTTAYEDALVTRPINAEQSFAMQNDRIAYLRSHGLPWAEAVYELRDQLEGLEDAEFWDGIPEAIRQSFESMTDHEQKEARKRFAERGWATHTVSAYRRVVNGVVVPVYRPSAAELSRELRIIRALATRQGIIWNRRRKSWLGFGLWGDEGAKLEGEQSPPGVRGDGEAHPPGDALGEGFS